MIKSNQRKPLATTKYYPFEHLGSRTMRMSYRADENQGPNEVVKNDTVKSTVHTWQNKKALTDRSYRRDSYVVEENENGSRIKPTQEPIKNLKGRDQIENIDEFVKYKCGSAVGSYTKREVKVLEEHEGNTKYRVTYEKKWGKCQATVLKTKDNRLELLYDNE